MAEHSKSTLLALNLELLRVEVTNRHMEQVIGELGRAVISYLNLDRYLLVFEKGTLWFEKQ